MISSSRASRQPVREPWTLARLVHERAIALGHAVDRSTALSYSSHLQSYLTFCKLHAFPVEPTPDTLSFYTVFMSHHIKPSSVDSYLSGICHELQSVFPTVRSARRDPLVVRTLAGCKRLYNTPVRRKAPLTVGHLTRALAFFPPTSHDNLLFLALLGSGFFALHRLGELVSPDSAGLRVWRKVILRSSAFVTADAYGYTLPGHKADRFYAGSQILVSADLPTLPGFQPRALFGAYLASRDRLFPLEPALWLTSSGTLPTRRWFLSRLAACVPDADIAGHSLRAGGATFYAAAGWPDDRIQALGRWSSEAFRIYIRQHPVLLQALLFARTAAPAPRE